MNCFPSFRQPHKEDLMAKVYTEHDRRIPKTPDEAFPTPGYLPVSAVMVSVADSDSGVPNIIPLTGWGFLNRLPLMLGIAINTTYYNNDYYLRGSLELLRKSMDFVLNVPTESMRDIWPAPMPTAMRFLTSTMAFDLTCLATRHANSMSSNCLGVGFFVVAILRSFSVTAFWS